MTYCLAMKLDAGLVFAADTRTNAGVDYVTAYGKMHVFRPRDDRLFVLLSAGNLAITQEIVDTLQRDLDADGKKGNLAGSKHLFEVVQYVGSVSTHVQDRHRAALSASGVSGEVSLILGGQIRGGEPEIFLIYPQGNYIHASRQTPYLQIGESKYGKPMLDRVLHVHTPLADAARLALVSLDATMRSNLTVGPPFDLAIYERDGFELACSERIQVDSPFYQRFRDAWQHGIEAAFRGLPPFEWESKERR
jgi:putative proteasome-type protease